MTLDELKAKVEDHRESLKGKSGHMVYFSETGPVGIGLIDAIVATMEAQQRRIEEIEKQISA
jgi:hypothetical protein